MDKRTFLKLLPAAAAAAPQLASQPQPKLTNWAGNLTYSSTALREAASTEQARSLVRSLDRMKVLGSRHCFNSIADTRDTFLSLKPMHEIVALDAGARSVTVEAGVTYGQLCPYLHSKGFALHNLASLPHISIAGACSTATHGSGDKNGNLATAVSAIEFIDGSGNTVRLSRKSDGDTFQGAVVALGALGVITGLTLDLEPEYQVRQYVYENLPVTQLKQHFEEIESAGYSVSLFTDWQKQRVNEVWVKLRVGGGAPAFTAPPDWFGARRATRNLHPIAELSADNCTQQMGVPGPWYDRLPHFRMGFTPSAGKELQAEYFVPRRNAVDAILAVERLGPQVGPHLLISEIRTIAADTLWMSTAYGEPQVAIHFTWKQDWPAVSRLLPVIERELSPYKPRPHWGKLFTLSRTDLMSRYEKADEFIRLASRFDPKGKFRNKFLNTNLFGGD
jgi:xylitol oxidase